MKKLVLLLALVVCGCTHPGESIEQPRPKSEVKLRFQIGDVVDLKIKQ